MFASKTSLCKSFGNLSYFHNFFLTAWVLNQHTVPAPIKDAASIQKLFFEAKHYGAFYPKLFIQE